MWTDEETKVFLAALHCTAVCAVSPMCMVTVFVSVGLVLMLELISHFSVCASGQLAPWPIVADMKGQLQLGQLRLVPEDAPFSPADERGTSLFTFYNVVVDVRDETTLCVA